VCGASCIDRGSSWYKENAKREEERETKSTQEIISKSETLQNLEKVCRYFPFFDETKPKVKSISKQNDKLFYHYSLQVDFENLKAEFEKKLPQNGWIFKKENRGVWKNQLEFEKGNYWVQFSNGNFGESNYAISCKDSTITN
jgi:hypothetical protein